MTELKDINFRYGEEEILTDFSLKVKTGEFILLTGASGCGKTTVLRLINGLIPNYYSGEYTGEVLIDGVSTCGKDLRELSELTGTVFQNPRSQFFCTETESELAFACENRGMPEEDILRRIEKTVRNFRIKTLLGRSLFEMSGGEKQKIACASLDVSRPEIILLDEPSANLDYDSVLVLRDVLKQWKKEGKTVIVAEHRVSYLKDIADRVVCMKKGGIAHQFSGREFCLMTDAQLETLGLRSGTFENPADCGLTPVPPRKISSLTGSITAVVGENGAGKTSYLRRLCGLGKYEAFNPDTEIKDRCFLVMQDVNHQLFTDSVTEEVMISFPDRRNDNRKEAEEILKRLDLEGLQERHPMSLSGGQKQRVAIACAIASGKDILLFDEPTSGLDLVHMKQTARLFEKLKAMGKTVIVATHDAEFIQNCCDKKVVIKGNGFKKREESALAWLFRQAGDRRAAFGLSIFTAFVSVLCSIAPYGIMAQVIGKLLDGERDIKEFTGYILLMGLFFCGEALFHAVSTSLSHVNTFSIIANIRQQCIEKLAKMPLGDVLMYRQGELKSTLMERIDAIETTLAHIVPEFTSCLCAPVILIGAIFRINVQLGIAAFIVIPLGLLFYLGMNTGYEENYGRTLRATKALNDASVEYISGIEVVKVFGRAKGSYEKFAAAAKEGAQSYVDWMRKCNIYLTSALVIMPATMLTVLPVGGLMYADGEISGKDLITVIIISVALIAPLVRMMSYSDDLKQINAITGEIRNILDSDDMERPRTLMAEDTPKDCSISFRDVHFGYQDREVLHGINLDISDGEYVALVGPSGSGKSTLAKLIAGLWDVKSGSISMGGTDYRYLPADYCSRKTAFVSQDSYLFNLSVKENIGIGKMDGKATDDEITEAAKKSGCYDFIMSLENGFDTVVGSTGGHLSGGERQRICIARAMLKDADIVILDEATAYTDPESEAVIQRSVAKLVEGKTLIVIAHRLSTVKDADCIFCMEDGNIREHGTHRQLLSENGLYRRMWDAHIRSRDNADAASLSSEGGVAQ